MSNWYEIKKESLPDTPALVVFPERVKHNAQAAVNLVGDLSRFRPHVKTNKSAEAIQQLLAVGVYQFKCATIAEAELLGSVGAKDVVLAYQPQGPKLQRFIKLIHEFPHTQYACLTDNPAIAQEQSDAFIAAGIKVPVYIDLNVGMNRTGIIPDEKALELYQLMHQLPGIIVGGFHAYDGHLRNPDILERSKECDAAYAKVVALKEKAEVAGLKVPVVIAGGSPSFPIHAARPEVQCSPGTFIYWDHGYSNLCKEQPFLPAAVLVTRVLSLPAPNKVCTDLGHKSVAAENEITKRIAFLNAPDLVATGQSEEHLVLEAPIGHSYKVGDVLYGLPYHICPTVALYESVFTIEDGEVTGTWRNTARDRYITF
ncbi:MAG: D-TA family PLP-dependent enzyme [Chitinophagaceae bacterium]|nr:D-TA family PLP-dependent enzyme [Chitinophagaceae bacterium]